VLPDPAPTEASGASTEQGPGTLAGKLSRCKEGMACVFAVQVQSWLNITRIAIQTFKVTEKLSWHCYFINSTGAVSRYNLSRSQKLVKVQKFDCEYWCEVRVPRSAGSVLVAGVKARPYDPARLYRSGGRTVGRVKTMTNKCRLLSVLGKVLIY